MVMNQNRAHLHIHWHYCYVALAIWFAHRSFLHKVCLNGTTFFHYTLRNMPTVLLLKNCKNKTETKLIFTLHNNKIFKKFQINSPNIILHSILKILIFLHKIKDSFPRFQWNKKKILLKWIHQMTRIKNLSKHNSQLPIFMTLQIFIVIRKILFFSAK
jgi:hypothetical protein